MRTIIFAAAAALTLGSGAAYAEGGRGTVASTFFTELPGVVAQAPVQNAAAVTMAQNGQALHGGTVPRGVDEQDGPTCLVRPRCAAMRMNYGTLVLWRRLPVERATRLRLPRAISRNGDLSVFRLLARMIG